MATKRRFHLPGIFLGNLGWLWLNFLKSSIGIYNYLPLGYSVLSKIQKIVDQRMQEIGILFPHLSVSVN